MIRMMLNWLIVRLVLMAIGFALALFLLNSLFGCSSQVPTPAATAMATRTATRTAAQAEPTEPPTPTVTVTPTATPTRKGIRAASGITETKSLAESVPTRVPVSPTVPKPTATLKPGETRAPEGQKIEVPNPLGGDPFTVPIPGGWTPMPTVRLEGPQLPGSATPTPTPKPTRCDGVLWTGIGCPSQPAATPASSAGKPAAPAEEKSNDGGFPWLLCGGGVLVLLIIGVIVLFRSGVLSVQNAP